MHDRGVITINRREIFSLTEAREILPIVRRITQEFSQKVDLLVARLQSVPASDSNLITEIEEQINGQIKLWNEKMKKLGAHPKGLWLVDFDCGDGYFCWKHPEAELLYWHAYEDGFTGRLSVDDYIRRRRGESETIGPQSLQ